jgi:hypothetical protein
LVTMIEFGRFAQSIKHCPKFKSENCLRKYDMRLCMLD